MIKFLLMRGKSSDLPKENLSDGEIAFLVDTKKLVVGWEGKAHAILEVVEGPHDQNLYAKVSDVESFIPMGIRR